VVCKEASNRGLLCADFQLFVSIALYTFDLPCERRTASSAANFAKSKPTQARSDNNRGDYGDIPSGRLHHISILPTRGLRKELLITGVYICERESAFGQVLISHLIVMWETLIPN
jgi:hypothetical protein